MRTTNINCMVQYREGTFPGVSLRVGDAGGSVGAGGGEGGCTNVVVCVTYMCGRL